MCFVKQVNNNSTHSSERLDFKLATKHTRWLFRSLGLWTIITEYFTPREKILSIFVHVICQFLMFLVIIPSFYYLFWSDEELKIKIAVFGPIGVTITCALKYYSVIRKRKNIRNCLRQIERDWKRIENRSDRAIMLQNVNKGNNVTVIFAIFMFTGGISHQAAAPFLPGSLVSILKNSSEHPLVFPVTIINFVFDTQRTPIYETIYCLHILIGAMVCTMSVSACNLGAILVTHVCGQIQIIISRLNVLVDLKNLKNNDFHKKKIVKIVDLHNNVVKFSLEIQNTMGGICLIEIVGATVIICVDEYYCLMERFQHVFITDKVCSCLLYYEHRIFQFSAVHAWKYHEKAGFLIYSTLFFAFTFNVFIFCYIGELLKDQFSRVGESIYMSDWHYLQPNKARNFIFMIIMAQNPIKLTANGLMELSCDGFTTVMKTTVTFFNILRMIDL